MFDIEIYQTQNGKCPYEKWRQSLDRKMRAIVDNRVNRIKSGNLGDWKRVRGSKNLFEIRIDIGAGYRVYYARKGSTIVLLLSGGNKGSQPRDIKTAARYLEEYNSRS